MTGTSERYPVPLRQLGCPANGCLTVRHTLRNVLDGDLPEPSPDGRIPTAGVYWPTSTFFPNFWTESEAAAQKFACSATGRAEILYCDHAFHRAG